MHGLEKRYAGKIEFIRVNILQPQSAPLMKEFGFSATPEFYLIDGSGRILGFWDAVDSEDPLIEAFESALSSK